jgi:hypothetical protein
VIRYFKLGAEAGEFGGIFFNRFAPAAFFSLPFNKGEFQSLALRFRGGEFAFELFNLAGSPPLPFIFWDAAIYNLLA